MLRTARYSLAFCLLVIICGPAAHAQTITANSCNASDVQAAFNSVTSSTNTVNIPAGTCTWTQQVTLTVPSGSTTLTIEGSTAMNCTGTAGTSSYACTPTKNTLITDSYAVSEAPILIITTGSGSSHFRLTGLAFQGGSVGSTPKDNGFIGWYGSSLNVRVDSSDFNTSTYSPNINAGGMTIFALLNGVADHNTFELTGESNGIRYYPGSGDYGDNSWSLPTNFGTSAFFFAENNVFTYGAANDCNDGGRMVMRYNTIIANPSQGDTGLWQGHAQGQGTQRDRGCRALEIYHNYITNPNPSNAQYAPGSGWFATGLVWDNTITAGYNYDVIFEEQREIANHNETAPPNGIGYCGNGSSGATSPWDANSNPTTGYPCIGQTGRGQGDLLNGLSFSSLLDTLTGSITWPHQLLEPWYVWGETIASGQVYNSVTWNGVPIVINRDFYVQTTPFTGATGVGVGSLSARPSACTAGPGGTYGTSPTGSYGVGYFATDANSGVGELYICTATNAWTPVYEPYPYPHPLVSGGTAATSSSNPPSAPTGLSATVQ